MTYIAFLVATGFYLLVGPGGPLHNDAWYHALRRRVDAIAPEAWLGFTLLVVVPCAVLGLVFAVLTELFGAAAMLLLGIPALFFSFGRGDWPALVERFRARAAAGDTEGALLSLEDAGFGTFEAESAEEAGSAAARALFYDGFQRWFPPVFYFLLLGPLFAVAYRLIVMGAADRYVPIGSLRHLVDWLPSRLFLLSLGIVGNFEALRGVLMERALDADIATDAMLWEGLEQAFPSANAAPADQVVRAREGVQRVLILWVVIASVLVIVA